MNKVRPRLILEYILVCAFGVSLVWMGAVWATGATFRGYVRGQHVRRTAALVPVLERYYELTGGWDGVGVLLRMPTSGMGQGKGRYGLSDNDQGSERIVLFDSQERLVFDSAAGFIPLERDALTQAASIYVNGFVVGSVLVTDLSSYGAMGTLENDFLSRVRLALLGAGAVSILVAWGLATRLSKGISDPIENLRLASSRVAHGEYGHEVQDSPGAPSDIKELLSSFNHMSRELEKQEETKRDFLRDVAHEVRTPLTIIKGNLEAISLGVANPDAETLGVMTDEVTRLEGLLGGLDQLDTVRVLPEVKLSPVSPLELVQKAIASVQAVASSRNIELTQEVQEGLPVVLADTGEVRQVYSNLLSNAFRYTPDDGRISLTAKKSTDGVEFTVEDTGPGITAEDLPKVFDRFFRGDRSRARATGGSGLGLAIAKRAIERQGGRIWVCSPSGEGASFHFTLREARDTPAS